MDFLSESLQPPQDISNIMAFSWMSHMKLEEVKSCTKGHGIVLEAAFKLSVF